MPDLQLNTAACAKFNCCTQENVTDLYSRFYADFKSNLFGVFHGIVTLIQNWMFKKFELKKQRFAANWFGNTFFFFPCYNFTFIFLVPLQLYSYL